MIFDYSVQNPLLKITALITLSLGLYLSSYSVAGNVDENLTEAARLEKDFNQDGYIDLIRCFYPNEAPSAAETGSLSCWTYITKNNSPQQIFIEYAQDVYELKYGSDHILHLGISSNR